MTGHVDWRAEFEKHLHALRGMLIKRLAAGRSWVDCDDAVCEAIGFAWHWWLKAIARGRDPRRFSTIIANRAAANVRAGFCFAGGNRLTDALSPANRCHRGYYVENIDDVCNSSNEHHEKAIIDGRRADPGNAARAHLDWIAWRGQLTAQLRAVLVELVAGDRPETIAARRGWTREHVYRLRRQLASAWRKYGVDCE